MYQIEEHGAENHRGYRIYFRDEIGPVSSIHDIPLKASPGLYNAIVRCPRWSNHRMEICMKEALNPIMQLHRLGEVKYVPNCFPYHGYMWNVCSLPQTWSNPEQADTSTGILGCNSPLEVLEIGCKRLPRGSVIQVKILGSLALLEDHQCKWKLIGINASDPVADYAKDIADVEKYYPDLLKRSVDWLRAYRVPEGRIENRFAFEGEARGAKATAEIVIDSQHTSWKELIDMELYAPFISYINTRLLNSPCYISKEDAENILAAAEPHLVPDPMKSEVSMWNFNPHLHRN
ncbi:inorganic pyrophosphatase-like [Ctenocephalides felis]|uniref:inorganic pyrophosphatase-like n=1 Tax=Ctenocephalides felis TaxID=7515 RepID=UPI000E6E5A31|nr:inorganic pyrophosphatase-like [Ctenocephalides felis]